MNEKQLGHSRAGFSYFLVLAAAFCAVGIWNAATGSVGVGIAFTVLGVALAIFALLRRRDERRRGR